MKNLLLLQALTATLGLANPLVKRQSSSDFSGVSMTASPRLPPPPPGGSSTYDAHPRVTVTAVVDVYDPNCNCTRPTQVPVPPTGSNQTYTEEGYEEYYEEYYEESYEEYYVEEDDGGDWTQWSSAAGPSGTVLTAPNGAIQTYTPITQTATGTNPGAQGGWANWNNWSSAGANTGSGGAATISGSGGDNGGNGGNVATGTGPGQAAAGTATAIVTAAAATSASTNAQQANTTPMTVNPNPNATSGTNVAGTSTSTGPISTFKGDARHVPGGHTASGASIITTILTFITWFLLY